MSKENQADQALLPVDGGAWDRRAAAHLLRRAQYGISHVEIERAHKDGLAATVERLTTPQEEPSEFVVADRLLYDAVESTGSIADLKAWWLYRMLRSANPLVEKMSLFWHNHFATSYTKVRSTQHMAAQNDLIRTHAIGSFRDLLHGMAHDEAMLIWLDSNANRKRHPNENFAREVMELFSLGIGNYTEKDIIEAARAFTGWHVREGKFWFDKIQHDYGTKTVFGKSGNFNGGDVIDLCLDHPACARFLATKLLRFLVMPAPDAAVVDALAGRVRNHNYQMAPVLRELLASQLFFSDAARYSIIKSPLDFVLGSYRALDAQPNLQEAIQLLAQLGQDVFQPPTVKGWDGGRLWINSAMVLQRANFANALTHSSRFGEIADPVESVAELELEKPQAIVGHYTELLLGRDISDSAASELERYVTQTQGNRSQRLRGLIHLILTMPEYQLG